MTLQELRFIVMLAREKHFGKAAAACFVSQPTLSIAVQKLEENLGILLFERNKNTVTVTQQGQQVIDQARKILEETEALKSIAKAGQDQLIGTLKLGAVYTIGPYLLPHLIKQLSKLAPQMPLEIHDDFADNLCSKLQNGDVDAIVISQPFNEPGIETALLYKESFMVVMPENHPLTRYKTIHEENLKEYTLLLLDKRHCFSEQVISACPTYFTTSKVQPVASNSLETIRHMTASGMGLTIFPTTAATTDLCPYSDNLLTIRPLQGKMANRSIALAWRKSFSRPKAIEILIEAIAKSPAISAIK